MNLNTFFFIVIGALVLSPVVVTQVEGFINQMLMSVLVGVLLGFLTSVLFLTNNNKD